jgi:predicted nucleic acid-binding protein
VIFLDTNVFIYAVGAPHPLREPSREFFIDHADGAADLVTSAEVLQELLHVYSRQSRWATLDAALRLATSVPTIVAVTEADVLLARALVTDHPTLDARDLLHLACCRRHGITAIKTYDTQLAAAVNTR